MYPRGLLRCSDWIESPFLLKASCTTGTILYRFIERHCIVKIDWSKAPEGAEEASVHQSGDVRWYKDITDGCCSVWLSRTLEWHGLDGTPSLRGREKRPVEDVDVSYSAIESDLTPTTGTDQQPDSGAVSIVRKVGERDPENKYMREILPGIWIDVYHLLDAFKTDSAAVDHAVKKCVAPGQRGVKDRIQDLEEARDSLNRAIEDAKMWEAAK